MARLTPGGVIQALEDRFGPEIARAFEAAMQDVADNADLGAIVRAIAAGDVEAAVQAMHVDPAAMAALEDAVEAAFRTGGAETAAALPAVNPITGLATAIRFNARNTPAEAWLRRHSSDMVTRITEDVREAARIRLADGMARGINPRTMGLDLVGRVDKQTGRRTGGVIGLSAPQERFVANMRDELGDLSARYFDREMRDKRFDGSVRRAIEAGTPIEPAKLEKIVAAYQRKLLKLRGETIGRTEAMTALHKAQDEALRQAVADGKLPANAIRRIWRHSHDARVRETHLLLGGKSVGLDEAFVTATGARLMFPGDPKGPAREVINCRCFLQIRVDWLANIE